APACKVRRVGPVTGRNGTPARPLYLEQSQRSGAASDQDIAIATHRDRPGGGCDTRRQLGGRDRQDFVDPQLLASELRLGNRPGIERSDLASDLRRDASEPSSTPSSALNSARAPSCDSESCSEPAVSA